MLRLRRTRKLLALLVVTPLSVTIPAHAQPTEEVPFITSPDNVTPEMLSVADVKRGDHVIDLGSDDAHIVILAANRLEAAGLGVEIQAHAGCRLRLSCASLPCQRARQKAA